jgi:hypothetical protein
MSAVASRKPQYSAVNNQDDDDAPLTDAEIRLLKREARKRKWVRRLRKCNDYAHALCK